MAYNSEIQTPSPPLRPTLVVVPRNVINALLIQYLASCVSRAGDKERVLVTREKDRNAERRERVRETRDREREREK